MSETVLSVIPTDPWWRPDDGAADRAMAVFRRLVPDAGETTVYRHDRPNAVDAGDNLVRIGCPRCRQSIDLEWYADLLEENEDGFTGLEVTLPCCGAAESLDRLEYDWPVGFARFELAAWNPDRDHLTDTELTGLAAALGHDVRQIMARI